MRRVDDGWHELVVNDSGVGTQYRFVVQTTGSLRLEVPDPASRSNPDGAHGASVVVDPHAHEWTSGAAISRQTGRCCAFIDGCRMNPCGI